MKMKMNHRFLYGILSLVLAAVIAFIAIPAVTGKARATCEIVRVTSPLSRGTLISASDVELVEVGSFNLPANTARHTGDVIGTYAATDLYPGSYILPEMVSSQPISSDQTLNTIPDGMVAISITTQTLASGLSDKLQSGDIIRLYHYDDTNALEPVMDIPELRFVEVLSVTDADGLDIDYTTPPAEDEEKQQTASITVQVTPEQAMLLTRYENQGILHIALVSRGNDSLAQELLERQSDILTQLYGSGSDESQDASSSLPGEDTMPETQDVPEDGSQNDPDRTDTEQTAE